MTKALTAAKVESLGYLPGARHGALVEGRGLYAGNRQISNGSSAMLLAYGPIVGGISACSRRLDSRAVMPSRRPARLYQ